MEPEGSFPHSQEPATHAYAQINTVHVPTSHFLKIHFNIILPYIFLTGSLNINRIFKDGTDVQQPLKQRGQSSINNNVHKASMINIIIIIIICFIVPSTWISPVCNLCTPQICPAHWWWRINLLSFSRSFQRNFLSILGYRVPSLLPWSLCPRLTTWHQYRQIFDAFTHPTLPRDFLWPAYETVLQQKWKLMAIKNIFQTILSRKCIRHKLRAGPLQGLLRYMVIIKAS